MPRRNENAERVYRPTESWIGLLPYQGRIELRKSGLQVTGESIVRDYRNQVRSEDLKVPKQIHIQGPPKSLFRKLFDRINWRRGFDLLCGALAAVAIAYIFGFVIFGPAKEFWK